MNNRPFVSRAKRPVPRIARLAAASVAAALAIGLSSGCADDEDTEPTGAGGEGGGGGGSGGGSGGACPGDPCELTLPQCGCPSDQQCTVEVWTGVVGCFDDPDDPAQVGEPCDGSSISCAAGSLCLDHHPNGPGSCHAFCDGQSDCALPGSRCLAVVDEWGEPIGEARVCSPSCSLLDGSGCVPGARCAAAQEPSAPDVWFTACVGEGDHAHGDSCGELTDCARGMCVDLGASGQLCLDLCDLDAPSCPSSSSCTPFVDPLQIDETSYGICLPS